MTAPGDQGSHRGYAIELYFDPALENQVLKAWNVLSRRHVSTHLIEIESRPHITLFSFSPLFDPHKVLPALRSFASRHDPLPLNFSFVGTFPSIHESGSVFFAPTPSASLLGLHSQLFEALKKDGIEVLDEFRPDYWVPHCAVAQDVSKSKIFEAFSVVQDLRLPISGYVMELGVVEFSPAVREVFSFSLGSAPDT